MALPFSAVCWPVGEEVPREVSPQAAGPGGLGDGLSAWLLPPVQSLCLAEKGNAELRQRISLGFLAWCPCWVGEGEQCLPAGLEGSFQVED